MPKYCKNFLCAPARAISHAELSGSSTKWTSRLQICAFTCELTRIAGLGRRMTRLWEVALRSLLDIFRYARLCPCKECCDQLFCSNYTCTSDYDGDGQGGSSEDLQGIHESGTMFVKKKDGERPFRCLTCR